MKNIAVIGAGISGLGGRLAAESSAPRAPLRTGAASGRPHQHRRGRWPERHRCARYRLPGPQRPHVSEPRAALRRARRGDPRLGHVLRGVVRAERARIQQPRRQRLLRAAAEPGRGRRTSRCSARSCASTGRRPRCSRRRTRNARRWATFWSPAVSVRASPIGICFRWHRPSGRPRSTRSDRFRRSRSSASSTTTGCSRSMRNRRGRSWPAAATPTFPGSSRTYRATLTRAPRFMSVRRREDAVTLTFRDRPSMRFDEVVFACHGDQVLPLLADPSDRERDVFSGFTTTTNIAWLHTDASMLPVQARARASWNYRLAGDADAPPTVTYDLNRLQGLTTRGSVLRDAQPERRDRRTSRAAPVRLSSSRSTRARPSARSGSGAT